MSRRFNIGDRIICVTSGVIGTCIKFYIPTSCEEQTMVVTDDGRRYHAPTREWKLLQENEIRGYIDNHNECDCNQKTLNPYGEYLLKFAKNHNMSIDEASEQPMVKARLEFFNKTGM